LFFDKDFFVEGLMPLKGALKRVPFIGVTILKSKEIQEGYHLISSLLLGDIS
jgi:hypothetical protein